jgi:hypothetical protein
LLRAAQVAAAALLVATSLATPARAQPHLLLGVAEDGLKWRSADARRVADDLGLQAFRITLPWSGQTELVPFDRAPLAGAVAAGAGKRLILSAYGTSAVAPVDVATRTRYCTYVRNVLAEFPQINDVVIWNEPNIGLFWLPQFNADGSSASPAAYEALLADCWDTLHALRSTVNVIGLVNAPWGNNNGGQGVDAAISPPRFIRDVGAAYRASGRTRPLFDTVGHHAYPASTTERPWRRHDDPSRISMGDWERLMQALTDAFGGTAQPIPGQGVPIWYLEVGFETHVPDDKLGAYTGNPDFQAPLPDLVPPDQEAAAAAPDAPGADQATQVADALRLAYCQPYVEAFFNFLLFDERDFSGYQSGLLWADGTPKGSYGPVRQAIADVEADRVDCSGPVPRSLSPTQVAKAGDPAGETLGQPHPSTRRSAGAGAVTPSADRVRTRLAFTMPRYAVFGLTRLSARLTTWSTRKPLPRRTVSFRAGGQTYSASTNAKGLATVTTRLPIGPGTAYVRGSFAGDAALLAVDSIKRLDVDSVGGSVKTRGVVQTRGAHGTFDVALHVNGVRGRLSFRLPKRTVTTRRIDGLGISDDGRSAWFAGPISKRTRLIAYVQDNSAQGRRDVVRLWVGGRRVVAGDVVTHGDIVVADS